MAPVPQDGDAAFGDGGRGRPEQLLGYALAERRHALDRNIAPRRSGLGDDLFGLAHGRHQRNLTVFVIVHADAEIDLLRTRIGGIGFDRGQHRIDGTGRQTLEKGLDRRAGLGL
jgi:hypothetical protein